MDGNVNQEVPIRVEPPPQTVAKPEATAPVEPKPAEEQQPNVGPNNAEQLEQQRAAIDALKQAGLINEGPQIAPPETQAAETIKPRQSLIARFLTWLMTFFGIRRPKTA